MLIIRLLYIKMKWHVIKICNLVTPQFYIYNAHCIKMKQTKYMFLIIMSNKLVLATLVAHSKDEDIHEQSR